MLTFSLRELKKINFNCVSVKLRLSFPELPTQRDKTRTTEKLKDDKSVNETASLEQMAENITLAGPDEKSEDENLFKVVVPQADFMLGIAGRYTGVFNRFTPHHRPK